MTISRIIRRSIRIICQQRKCPSGPSWIYRISGKTEEHAASFPPGGETISFSILIDSLNESGFLELNLDEIGLGDLF